MLGRRAVVWARSALRDYALEEAQHEGLLEVEEMYMLDRAEADVLKIYLSHVDDEEARVNESFVEKGRQVVERRP